MPIRVEYADLFPSHSRVEEALLVLLYVCGGRYKAIRARDCYRPLANHFDLNEREQKLTRSEYYENDENFGLAWNNTVQWARRKIQESGYLESVQRGVWQLSETGSHRAEAIVANLSPIALDEFKSFKIEAWKNPLDSF